MIGAQPFHDQRHDTHTAVATGPAQPGAAT